MRGDIDALAATADSYRQLLKETLNADNAKKGE
jgi:hypothetical protein